MSDASCKQETFARLAEIVAPYRAALIATTGKPDTLVLETPPSPQHPGGFYFGKIACGKRYVSFHLMPVYTNPELLGEISPALRARMQGKSCFNFTRPDEALREELQRLTAAGFARFTSDGRIPTA